MDVLVYTKSECVQCKYTKQFLDKQGTRYTEIDAGPGTEANVMLASKGVSSLPYVVAGNQTWTGFKMDKIRGLPKADHA